MAKVWRRSSLCRHRHNEDTFRNTKQLLGGEQPQTWKAQGPERAAALSFWTYSAVWLWYLACHGDRPGGRDPGIGPSGPLVRRRGGAPPCAVVAGAFSTLPIRAR